MTTLAEMPKDELEGATHLLLCGPSKTGKTRYIANLVLDGFTVLYVDNDNGLSTLRACLEHNPAALARVHYIRTADIWSFMSYFFARDRFQWNKTQDRLFSALGAEDTDLIHEIYRKRIPLGVVLVFDSWTSASNQLLRDSAAKNEIDYDSFNEKGQAVFGDARRRADVLCMNIQSHPGHVIVQAHQEQYEILEKKKGLMKEMAKQSEMMIKDNVTVPFSVSRPHGFAMPKYFNQVGWMGIDLYKNFTLDFRQLSDRVGGGSPMKIGDPEKEMRFSNTFAKPREIEGEWIRTVPALAFKEEAAAEAEAKRIKAEEAKAAAAAAKANGPTNPTPLSSPVSKLPGKSLLGTK